MITYASRKRSFAAFSSDDASSQEPGLPTQPTTKSKALQPTTGNVSKLPTPPASDPLSPMFKHTSSSPKHNNEDVPSSPLHLAKARTIASLFRSASAPSRNTTSIPPARSSEAPPVKKQKMTQLTIDLGGPPNTRCKTCGMEYIPSSAEDRALHSKFHAKSVGGVDVPASLSKALKQQDLGVGTESERLGRGISAWRIVKRVVPREALRKRVEGKNMFERVKRRVAEFEKGGGMMDAIVEVWCGDTRAVKGFAKRVLERVERELGAVETDEKALWDLFGPCTDYKKLDGGVYKVYLYVRGTKCVGCVLGQRIRKAQKARFPAATEDNRCGGALQPSGEYVDAELGISRIWVSKEYQRSGIASELLDAAATHYFSRYGCQTANVRQIPRRAVAFSQPTEAGLKLIEGYINGKGLSQRDGEKELKDEEQATAWLLYDEWEAQELREPKMLHKNGSLVDAVQSSK